MTPITDDFQGHLGLAALITGGLEMLKKADLPGLRWISDKKPATLVFLSAGASMFVSLGFQWTWEQSWPDFAALLQNGGTMNLSVSIPSLDTILRAIGQMAMNYMVYHGSVKPVTKAIGGEKSGTPLE